MELKSVLSLNSILTFVLHSKQIVKYFTITNFTIGSEQYRCLLRSKTEIKNSTLPQNNFLGNIFRYMKRKRFR